MMQDRWLSRGKALSREGKTIAKGDWVYGAYVDRCRAGSHSNEREDGTYPAIYVSDENGARFIPVDPATIGQCTGLRDINDKLVFEGDIVHFTVFDYQDADTQYIGVVKYSNAMWEVWKDKDFEYYGNNGAFVLGYIYAQDDELEIIGNIHDNPELLKEG